MSETFESLELSPWIVRQTAKLGKDIKIFIRILHNICTLQCKCMLTLMFFFLIFTIRLGLKSPTPIQVNCIPKILSGSDCVGAAKTGYLNDSD